MSQWVYKNSSEWTKLPSWFMGQNLSRLTCPWRPRCFQLLAHNNPLSVCAPLICVLLLLTTGLKGGLSIWQVLSCIFGERPRDGHRDEIIRCLLFFFMYKVYFHCIGGSFKVLFFSPLCLCGWCILDVLPFRVCVPVNKANAAPDFTVAVVIVSYASSGSDYVKLLFCVDL